MWGLIRKLVSAVIACFVIVLMLVRFDVIELSDYLGPADYHAAWYAPSGYLTCKNFEYNLAGPGGRGGEANCEWFCNRLRVVGGQCACRKGRVTHADCPRIH